MGESTERSAPYDAILGLGSNIGDKRINIERAGELLAADSRVTPIKWSKFYRSPPWGVQEQDWFINACLSIATDATPMELLWICQHVENEMGRVRKQHWGPRIIDIDILVIGNRSIDEPDLKVPHPYIAERAFVLLPLADIDPGLTIGGSGIRQLLADCNTLGVEPV